MIAVGSKQKQNDISGEARNKPFFCVSSSLQIKESRRKEEKKKEMASKGLLLYLLES
jgi:hypothetical protein